LLAAFDELDRARAAETRLAVEQQYGEDAAKARQWRSAGIAEPILNGSNESARELFDSAIWSWGHPAAEDSEVPQAGTAVLHWLVDGGQPGPAGRSQGWRRVGGKDVRRVHATRERLKDVDNALGGGAALPMAVAYLRQELPPLLGGKYDAVTGRALAGAVAEVALDVGWMAYDAGNQPEARRQMIYALRLSGIADDRLFGGRVACALSHQALHLGRVGEAMDLAQAARASTRTVAGPAAIAMFSAMQACAAAAADRQSDCFEALRTAEKAIQKTRPDESQPAWLDFDNGGVAGHAARAMCALGRHKEAQQFATFAIENCRPDHSRTRAQRNALLARALIQGNDMERAAAVGDQVVDGAWVLHSVHVCQEVQVLANALKPSRAADVRRFVEHAHELLRSRQSSYSFSTT